MDEPERISVGFLRLRRAAAADEPIPLQAGDTVRVGRVSTNDLVLDDHLVSRFHAVFNASRTGIVVSDLSSLNGTYLNGRRISTPVQVRPGDVVAIGETEIAIEAGADQGGDAGLLVSRSSEVTMAMKLKEVTITLLLADVCGYTRISEQLPPAEVAAMLQLWFRRVSDTVEEFGGEVDKYIGDCVMALWRGSKPEEMTLGRQAATAALAIIERTDALSESGRWPHHEAHPWRCRISLHSGEALQGTLGGARARDHTVLGDTVNVAFRLNDLAGRLERPVLASAESARLIEDAFVVESLGSTPVEGRSGLVEIYSLAGRKVPNDPC